MHYHACRRMHCHCAGIGDRVVHSYKFNAHTAHSDILTGYDHVQRTLRQYAVLTELSLDKSERQPCAVYGYVYLLKEVGECAYVVLVTVRQHNTPYLLPVLFEIGEVGDNKIDTEHIVIGKSKSAIYDEYIVTALVNVDVFAYLVYAAERHNPYGCLSAALLFVLRKERGILLLSRFLFILVIMRLVVCKNRLFIISAVCRYAFLFIALIVGQYGLFVLTSVVGKYRLFAFRGSFVSQYRLFALLSVVGQNCFICRLCI